MKYTIQLSKEELIDLFTACDDSIALHLQTDDEAANSKDLWLEVLEQTGITFDESIKLINEREK